MRPPRAPSVGATRPPLVPLAVLYFIPLVVAFLTPASDFVGGPQGDVALYFEKARGLVGGATPYKDLPLEYPPLALVPMVVPFLLWPFGQPTLNVYTWLFAGEQAVLLLALGLVVGRIVSLGGGSAIVVPGEPRGDGLDPPAVAVRQRAAGWRLVALAAGASLALTWRFDLFPTLLMTVGVWAALERRATVTGLALGLGFLTKLFPVIVGPAVAVRWLARGERRGLIRLVEAGLAAVVLGMAPFVALAGIEALIFVGYQLSRGLQIESVGGGLVLLGGLAAGQPITLHAPFSAWEVTGGVADAFLASSNVLLVVGMGVVAVLGWRRLRDEFALGGTANPGTIVALSTASLLVLVATSKVLSIQYVVWLLPFAALLPRWPFRLTLAAVALTIPIHPVLYDDLVAQEALPILVLNLRNALIVTVLALVLWDLAWRRPRDRPSTTA